MPNLRIEAAVTSELSESEVNHLVKITLRRIARRYSKATAHVLPGGRLSVSHLIPTLKVAYRATIKWRQVDVVDRAIRTIRSRDPTIDFRSTDILVILRGALTGVDLKRVSKWAAALDAADFHNVPTSELAEFLEDKGGIEGAARTRAKLWATKRDGEWAKRSPLRRKLPEPPFHVPKGRVVSSLPRQVRRWRQRLANRGRDRP